MALVARRQASRLGRLVDLMSCNHRCDVSELQPCRQLFGWAAQRLPAEPSVPSRPAKRACGLQEWVDEYRCVLAVRGKQQRMWFRRSRLPPPARHLPACCAYLPLLLHHCSWLEGSGADVQRVLRQERRYAEGWLRRTAQLAEQLHEEMLELAPTEQVGFELLCGWGCPWCMFSSEWPHVMLTCYGL